MPRPRRTAKALARTNDTGPASRLILGFSLIFLTFVAAAAVRAEEIIKAYGFSTFGEFKYAPDFKHLDYVNPDAPKGGEISVWAQGTFDTFNPYSSKGRAAVLSTIGYESLMTGTADEISAEYCLLCE
ncbi:MAG: ABC transporter substrate-binding protein, partial [Paracoccaceae bacterium]